MAAHSLLIPFEAADGISPLPVTTWVDVTVVLVTVVFFNGPFGDGVAFVTVDVVAFLIGVTFLAAVVFVVRADVVNVDADAGRLDAVVFVVDEVPPAVVVRVVLVFDKTFDAGLCWEKCEN